MTERSQKRAEAPEAGFLVLGLALLTTLLMFCGVCVTVAFHSASRMEIAQKLRLKKLNATAREAELLNRISANNALILSELSMTLQTFRAAHEPALLLQIVLPFWTSQSSQELSSKPPTFSELFQEASKTFAHHLRLAHNLSLDSARAQKELSKRNPFWSGGLKTGEPSELLCQVIELLAAESSSRPALPIPPITGLRIPGVRLTANTETCSLTLKALYGAPTEYWHPEALLGDSHGIIAAHPRLTWVTPQAPLCTSYTQQAITADPFKIAQLYAKTFTFKTGPGQIEIRHPDLQHTPGHLSRCEPFYRNFLTNSGLPQSDFLPLSPHWAPVYLTDRTGG